MQKKTVSIIQEYSKLNIELKLEIVILNDLENNISFFNQIVEFLFKNIQNMDDLWNKIIYLKGLLSNFRTESFKIAIKRGDIILLIIKYHNNVLEHYKYNGLMDENLKNGSFKVVYDINKGFHFSYLDCNLMKKLQYDKRQNPLMRQIEKIENLKKMSKQKDENLSFLYRIYYLFYDEPLNLLDEKLIDKIQALVYILNYYGFSFSKRKFIIGSNQLNIEEIDSLINDFLSIGIIKEFNAKLGEVEEDKIKLIGDATRDYVSIEGFVQALRAIYSEKYQNGENISIHDILNQKNSITKKLNK